MDGSRFRLDGRVALVTGASRGIGRATVEAFLNAGASVVLVARDQQRLREVEAELARAVGRDRVMQVAANAGDAEAPPTTVAAAIERFGRLDVLVNNAATSPHYGPLVDISAASLTKTTEVNLFGPVRWIGEACRAWMIEHGGVVINTVSLGAFIAEAGIGAYAMTKAALVQVTKQLAAELGPTVRVNAVAPGLVKTDMARVLWEGKEAEIAASLPLKRLGTPEDIAAAMVFLASDASSWMTGHTLVVDGGALVTHKH